MRRRAGRHSDRNPLRPVNQKMGDLDRKNRGFSFGLVKIRDKIYDIFIQIGEKVFLCHLLQPGFGITHGCSAVSLYGAEIPVSVHKRECLFKLLCHHDERIIDGAVPMRVILTHGIAHDSRTFTIRLVITNAKLIHIIKGSSLHRF